MTSEPLPPEPPDAPGSPDAGPEVPSDEQVARALARARRTLGRRRRRRRLLVAVPGVVVILGLAGALAARDPAPEGVTARVAESTEPPATAGDDPSAIWGRTWRVTRIVADGAERDPSADGAGAPIDLDLRDQGSISYQVCNHVGVSVDLVGDELRALSGGSTLMGCGDPRGEQEHWFGTFFQDRVTVAVDGDRLTLRHGNNTVELVETAPGPDPVPPPSEDDPSALWGRRWALFGITVDGAPREVAPPLSAGPVTRWTIDATHDGTLTVESCAPVAGAAHLEGAVLRWQATDPPEAACAGSGDEARVAQDAALFGLLAAGPRVVVRGTWMYVLDDTTVVMFMAADR